MSDGTGDGKARATARDARMATMKKAGAEAAADYEAASKALRERSEKLKALRLARDAADAAAAAAAGPAPKKKRVVKPKA